mmetsp:Transcript_12826/g.16584  ORF Transcript_12826/g.16584 Transcript_12826/m.16584 type:complete len:687 (-) Transcript_12826:135-2195(-)
MFKPKRSEFGANTPFETGEITGSVVTYNPKSTGIEYERKMDYAVVKSNTTYARIFSKFNLGEFQYRNYQWIYVYAILGREIDDSMTKVNSSYTYMQHMKISLSAFTYDGLGEVVLVEDYEVTKRVQCNNLEIWCRKLPVAVVNEINYPKYELKVRFSRPNNNIGSKNYWNSTIPILGKVTYEYVSPMWLSFEIIIRYGFNILSGAVFFYPKTGLWPSLKQRPVEDFTAHRCFGVLLFVVLFFFNEPFFIFQVFIPDAQNIFRVFAMMCTTLASAVYLGFITHLFYGGKFTDPRPPSLVIWVEGSKKQQEREQEEERKRAEIAAASLPSGVTLPPKPPPPTQQRSSNVMLKTPMFFMASAKYLEPTSSDEEEDEEAQKKMSKKELKKLKTRRRKKSGIKIAEDGYTMFYNEFKDQVLHGMTEILADERGGKNWKMVWRDIVGPTLIFIGVILVWITSFNLYLAQMNDGPTPRPRLTFSFALGKHSAEGSAMVFAVAYQCALLLGVIIYAAEDLSLSIIAYLFFLGVSCLTGLFILMCTLNCSFYTLGTPFIEVVTSRTLFNCYAWVVSFMIRPLETVGGRFSKRWGNTPPTGYDESDSEDYESEEEIEEEEDDKTVKTVTSALTIPSMGGVDLSEDQESKESSEEEESEEDGSEEEEGPTIDEESSFAEDATDAGSSIDAASIDQGA